MRITMKTSTQVLLFVASIGLAAAVEAAEPAAPARNPANRTDAAVVAKDPRLAQLKKGMPAAEVIKIFGQPKSVKSMAAPSGKAEVWVYRELVSNVCQPVQVGTRPITIVVHDGDRERTDTIAEEPIFKMQRKVVEQVTSLLLFNDHFLEQKTAREESRTYE